ncbi:hypothetical protein BDQ17DRAFT_1430978 [Cyathus striatus]|nr:hypothetical protein BDQ17DRAFT_1430978 [Cyathus striatus]
MSDLYQPGGLSAADLSEMGSILSRHFQRTLRVYPNKANCLMLALWASVNVGPISALMLPTIPPLHFSYKSAGSIKLIARGYLICVLLLRILNHGYFPCRAFTVVADTVASLDKVCKETNVSFPTLDEPFTPQSEALRANPIIADAANQIAAAAMQLVMNVLPAPHSAFTIISGHFKGAALRVCLEANVTEILREAGPRGMHVNDIAARSGINSVKLGRLLRYLATLHVYKELTPDVFTNNRISSTLDTGKSVEELFAKSNDNTHGFAALAGHHLDEVTKSSAYLWESMHDQLHRTRTNRLNHHSTTARQRRFDAAMRGVAAMQPPDAILNAFDWKSLPNNSVVVDVGGGDRPIVVEEGIKVWQTKNPEALESRRIEFQGHDFFTAQPVKNASVFLLKQIMHDWPNFYASKILVELRKVAQPDTKLLLIDSILPLACKDPRGADKDAVPGAVPCEADAPLLANYGIANEMGYNADMTMLNLFNSLERTMNQIEDLLKSSGWKLMKVHRPMEPATSFNLWKLSLHKLFVFMMYNTVSIHVTCIRNEIQSKWYIMYKGYPGHIYPTSHP